MSAGTTLASTAPDGVRITPLRVLHSEWLKLVTVRSTFWTSAVALVLAAVVSLLVGLALSRPGIGPGGGSAGVSLSLLGATASLSFVALVVGVLGVLAISGEYTTQQIRSSYTAVPHRWAALVAKGVVVGAWSFVLGLVITFGGFGLLSLLLGGRGVDISLGGGVAGGLVGGAAYLAVIGVFAVGLGALVRSSAAGITILTAVLFVLPIILGLLVGLLRAQWASTVNDYLLDAAGADLHAAPGASPLALWAIVLTLVCWVAAVWVPALVTTAQRDV